MNQTATEQTISPAAPTKVARVKRTLKSNPLTQRTKRIADLVRAKNPRLNIEWTRGSDPECMILDTESNQIVSSIPLLKRDKTNPIQLPSGGQMFADNVCLECSFPPSKTNAQMIKTMRATFNEMQEILGTRYRLIPKAAHVFPDSDLVEQYNIDPMKIGCEDSYLAWSMTVKEGGMFSSGLRTGSFHLHMGADALKVFANRVKAVKLLDIYLGLSSVLFDKDPGARDRRALYGVAGENRTPPHGLEYRVCSPFALRSPALVDLTLDLADHALNPLRDGTADELIASVNGDEIQRAINTCDTALAERILSTVNMPTQLMERVHQEHGPLDMYSEWQLSVPTDATSI